MKKDGKYAFVVLACSFCSLTISLGIPSSFGIFLTTLLDYLKNTNRNAEVVAVSSIAYAILNLSGPVASWLYRRYGCRTVIITGTLLGSFGLFCSYFTTQLKLLYVSYGVFCGFGIGFIYFPSLAIIPEYFDKYKYFATSFATVGSALGTVIMPQIFLHLIAAYTWRGAMLILAGIMLQIFIFGMFMKSSPISVVPQQQLCWCTSSYCSSATEISSANVNQRQILKDAIFYLLCFETFCFCGCSYTIFSLISAFIVSKGLTLNSSATLVSVIGFSSIGSRLASSVIVQLPCTNRRLFFIAVTAICALSSYCIVLCNNFWQFVVCMVIFGGSFGSKVSQVSGLLIDTFGVHQMANVIGYYFFAGGIGAFVIPPLAGFVADTSTLANAIIFAASVNLFDTLICRLLFTSRFQVVDNKDKDSVKDKL